MAFVFMSTRCQQFSGPRHSARIGPRTCPQSSFRTTFAYLRGPAWPRMDAVDALQNLSGRPLHRDLDIPKALHPWHRLGMETPEMSNIKTEQAATLPDHATSLLGADYLPQETLARELGVSERTLARWHVLRIGPPRCTVGKTILYRRQAVLTWLESREDKPRQKRGRG